jgi:two-component system, NarL family, response regulator DesR
MEQHSVSSIRVGLLDDHILVSALLAQALSTDERFSLVGTASTLHDGLTLIETHEPNVVLVDEGLLSKGPSGPTTKGLDSSGDTRFIVMCERAQNVHANLTSDPSCAGVIVKDRPVSEILDAVIAVSRGEHI